MDKQEAKLLLQGVRPNSLDMMQPPFVEAMALVESDPELRQWWETEQAFDRAVAKKLKAVPVPDNLRATILAGRKIEQFQPPAPVLPWLAIAAAVAILCAIGTGQYIKNYGPESRDEYTAAILPLIYDNVPALGMTSGDRDKVMAWLKNRNAPMGALPPKMMGVPTAGCQEYSIHGHKVSLICFITASGDVAHLFIVNKDALNDPPGTTGAGMDDVQGWCTASWSDEKMTYVLATQAGPDVLQQML